VKRRGRKIASLLDVENLVVEQTVSGSSPLKRGGQGVSKDGFRKKKLLEGKVKIVSRAGPRTFEVKKKNNAMKKERALQKERTRNGREKRVP